MGSEMCIRDSFVIYYTYVTQRFIFNDDNLSNNSTGCTKKTVTRHLSLNPLNEMADFNVECLIGKLIKFAFQLYRKNLCDTHKSKVRALQS